MAKEDENGSLILVTLSARQLRDVDRRQQHMRRAFRNVRGKHRVAYLGKEFIVLKNVFWPFADSQPLIKNFRIRRGERVLDMGTGSGVIAIMSAYRGAGEVLAVDVSPRAVACAMLNIRRHHFEKVISVKRSNMFTAVPKHKKYDVITANLPFRNKPAADDVEATQWDEEFRAHQIFFSRVKRYLAPGGRIYMAQANFGGIPEMKKLARNADLIVRQIGTKPMPKPDPRIFYAFEIRRRT